MLEAISCTGCGSTDVQEVEPSTYFCNHCETVFKHVDPGRLAVSYVPGFCDCGSGKPVTAQCQACRSQAICEQCDAGSWSSPLDRNRAVIQAVGEGYPRHGPRLKIGTIGDDVHFDVIDRTINWCFSGEVEDGELALPVVKLRAAVSRSLGLRALEHVCVSCLAGALPKTAQRLATGAECVDFWCASPGEPCRSCGRSFCAQHRSDSTGNGRFYSRDSVAGRLSVLSAVKAELLHTPGLPAWPLRQPADTCGSCLGRVAEYLHKVCECGEIRNESTLPPGWPEDDRERHIPTLVIRAEKKRTQWAQNRSNERARVEAERRWGELSDYAERLVASGTFRGASDTAFAAVDNRSSAPGQQRRS
jgi:hypothetical protein